MLAGMKALTAQALLLDPVNEAMALVHRFQAGGGFRGYVMQRLGLVVPVAALIIVTSLACAAATVLFLGGTRSLLVLFAMLLVPFVLAGSFFVQAYVFAYWLEGRALARALPRKRPPSGAVTLALRRAGVDMGAMPAVPWVLALLFVVLPLLMLIAVVPALGISLVFLLALAPVVFARLDQ